MNNKLLLEWIYELCWFAIAAIIAYLVVLPVKSVISEQLLRYTFLSLVLIVTYFRFTAFMMRSILLRSIWIKLLLIVLNVALFFFLLNQYYTYGRVFDEYNFTLPADVFQHIRSGTGLKTLMYIKQMVTFSGVISLFLTIAFEIRLIVAVFQLRQLDKYLVRN